MCGSIPPSRATSIAVGLGIFAYNLQRMTVITGSWACRLAVPLPPRIEPAPVVAAYHPFFGGK